MDSKFSERQLFLINHLRSFLSMRLQAAAGSAFQLPAQLGDEELWEDWRNGLSMFNSYPTTLTFYTFQDMYQDISTDIQAGDTSENAEMNGLSSVIFTPVMMCALFFTGMRLQWFEAGKHFAYNDNGISIERKKQGDYQNIVAANIMTYLQATLPLIKKTIGFSSVGAKGQFSGMIAFPRSLTRGLRGTRMGSGRG